jgi:ribosome-associated protein
MFDQDKPSKTRRKKDMHVLQDLGERLVELSPAQLAEIELPESLRDAVEDARSITKHEARRRQMQFIGRIMRDVDPAAIREQLARWDGQSREATRELHEIERWRERLIDDDAALTEFAARFPRCDLQAIRTLIRETRREATLIAAGEAKPRKHYRELFKMIREVVPVAPEGAGTNDAPDDVKPAEDH